MKTMAKTMLTTLAAACVGVWLAAAWINLDYTRTAWQRFPYTPPAPAWRVLAFSELRTAECLSADLAWIPCSAAKWAFQNGSDRRQ